MFKRILVALDGTPTANRGLAVAIGLAKEQQSTLHLVHAIDDAIMVPLFVDTGVYVPDYLDTMLAQLRNSGRKLLDKAEALAAKSALASRQHLVDTRGRGVAAAIVQQAENVRADLIVMGTHGRRGMRRLVMGSDAEGVLRDARVPVLLVRTPEKRPARKAVKQSAGKATVSSRRRTSPPVPRPRVAAV